MDTHEAAPLRDLGDLDTDDEHTGDCTDDEHTGDLPLSHKLGWHSPWYSNTLGTCALTTLGTLLPLLSTLLSAW